MNCPNLFHLIWLRFCAFSLKVNLLFDTRLAEHMVTPAGPLCETQTEEERSKLLEADIGVGLSAQNSLEDLLVPRHVRRAYQLTACSSKFQRKCWRPPNDISAAGYQTRYDRPTVAYPDAYSDAYSAPYSGVQRGA